MSWPFYNPLWSFFNQLPYARHYNPRFVFFFTKFQKTGNEKNVFYVIAFDPNKIQACQAHQNDHLKLNFVKYINVVGQKKTREGCKMANSQICLFFYASDYRLMKSVFKFVFIKLKFLNYKYSLMHKKTDKSMSWPFYNPLWSFFRQLH